MKEKSFEKKVKEYLRDVGAYYFKHWGGTYTQAGVPDILACYKGYFIGLELKTDTGKVSELQKYNINKINKLGGFAVVISPSRNSILNAIIKYIDDGYVENLAELINANNQLWGFK